MLQLPQAPPWAPYQIRSRWDNRRIAAAVAPILDSPPIPVSAARSARLEVHMPVCKRDLHLALVALKSLLRFADVAVAVSFTDDGSLGSEGRELLQRHVPGCRIWDRSSAASLLEATLKDRPHLREFYHSGHVFGPKLIHPSALTEAPKAMLLDSDTAFFRSPKRIWSLVATDNASPTYMHDHRDENAEVPETVRGKFRELTLAVAPNSEWRIDHYFFNAGLLLFRPQSLDFDLADRYLGWRKAHRSEFENDPLKIWFGDWTVEQTSYQAMFALGADRATPFQDEYWIGFDPNRTFCHFLRHYLIQGPTLKRLHALAKELARGG